MKFVLRKSSVKDVYSVIWKSLVIDSFKCYAMQRHWATIFAVDKSILEKAPQLQRRCFLDINSVHYVIIIQFSPRTSPFLYTSIQGTFYINIHNV